METKRTFYKFGEIEVGEHKDYPAITHKEKSMVRTALYNFKSWHEREFKTSVIDGAIRVTRTK